MKVKLLLGTAQIPVKKREGDAGFDVFAPYSCIIPPGNMTQVKLGIAIEIHKDEVALIQERSGMALNHKVFTIGNVIDSNYRGEISAMIYNGGSEDYCVVQGNRIAQILVLKLGELDVGIVNDLSDTNRGESGYGSSGI